MQCISSGIPLAGASPALSARSQARFSWVNLDPTRRDGVRSPDTNLDSDFSAFLFFWHRDPRRRLQTPSRLRRCGMPSGPPPAARSDNSRVHHLRYPLAGARPAPSALRQAHFFGVNLDLPSRHGAGNLHPDLDRDFSAFRNFGIEIRKKVANAVAAQEIDFNAEKERLTNGRRRGMPSGPPLAESGNHPCVYHLGYSLAGARPAPPTLRQARFLGDDLDLPRRHRIGGLDPDLERGLAASSSGRKLRTPSLREIPRRTPEKRTSD